MDCRSVTGMSDFKFQISGGWSGLIISSVIDSLLFFGKWVAIGYLLKVGWNL